MPHAQMVRAKGTARCNEECGAPFSHPVLIAPHPPPPVALRTRAPCKVRVGKWDITVSSSVLNPASYYSHLPFPPLVCVFISPLIFRVTLWSADYGHA